MREHSSAFYSENGKRRVLVVDDEAINRELLGAILEKDYDVIFACDGKEALSLVETNRDVLSLVILDLIMPNMSGQEVLRTVRANEAYQDIPIIVASGDETQEITCLMEGASDFIQKPYPDAGVILARVQRTIELFEGRQIIHSTERDPLTGLYNREFFYEYAAQYDQHHKDTEMDAIVLNINHFGMLNERYGRAYGDEVLRRVGERAREMVHASGGIVCRKEADIFHVYCPHREDYKAILDNASIGLSGEGSVNSRVRLRMGVYSKVDKTLDLERRFDRAKMAADTVRNSVTRNIGVYDDTLHKAELYSERLIDDFEEAIATHQFKVFYQPKFDIKPKTPVLCAAEGLVRWEHPELGRISPGVFIPLFEENGLIQKLDHYVWREAAKQIRDWKERLGYSVPVSVNASRIDMYDPDIIYTILQILEENHLEAEDLHLEVTESAYAEDAEQIVEVVRRLRALGLKIEMDDFGTGYSSLNMLSTLPIDVLKLDMKFIQTAFAQEKDTHMLKVIIEIAEHLSAPVVAEGVETEEQLNALREIGCDIVQGYYFSPPVPSDKFEEILVKELGEERKEEETSGEDMAEQPAPKEGSFFSRLSQRYSIPLQKANIIFVTLALFACTALTIGAVMVMNSYRRTETAIENALRAREAAEELELGSDYLTDQVRCFVVTGEYQYLANYFEEADVARRRDRAVEDVETLLEGKTSGPYEYLSTALSYSNELMEQEYHAMNLILSAGDFRNETIPAVLADYPLSKEETSLSNEKKQALAVNLVYGDTYMEYKRQIKDNTQKCMEELITTADNERERSNRSLNRILGIQTSLMVVMFALILLMVLYISFWIKDPLIRMVEYMKNRELIPSVGAQELRYVSETFNLIFEENQKTHERLTFGSMHDALTGLYNRNAYDFMKYDLDMSKNALLLMDVDRFKTINDTYGHEVGDLVLKRVAEILKYSFRPMDLVFRIGGDEFVVIMANVDSSKRERVRTIIDQVNMMLQKPKDDMPPTSLSVGVAFADRKNAEGDIFQDADTALYRVKEAGRCGCEIY